MTVSEQLDALRADIPGCVLAAFGDVAAQLVLRSSADSPWSQEKLDDLCRTGARQFALSDALTGFRAAPEGMREAIVATRRDVRVFVAAPAPAGDILCCVCRSSAQTGQVVHKARTALSELMGREQ